MASSNALVTGHLSTEELEELRTGNAQRFHEGIL